MFKIPITITIKSTLKKNITDKTEYLEQFKDFMYYSSNEDFIKGINSWVDLKNVIDWHLLLLYTNNGDGIRKNFYLYKLDNKTPFRFAIWDYDHSFGRDGDNEKNMMERPLQCNTAVLLKRLQEIQDIGYEDMLIERWHELRKKGIFSELSFEKHIQSNNIIIKNHLEKKL